MSQNIPSRLVSKQRTERDQSKEYEAVVLNMFFLG